jgi:hypothetical protein
MKLNGFTTGAAIQEDQRRILFMPTQILVIHRLSGCQRDLFSPSFLFLWRKLQLRYLNSLEVRKKNSYV